MSTGDGKQPEIEWPASGVLRRCRSPRDYSVVSEGESRGTHEALVGLAAPPREVTDVAITFETSNT